MAIGHGIRLNALHCAAPLQPASGPPSASVLLLHTTCWPLERAKRTCRRGFFANLSRCQAAALWGQRLGSGAVDRRQCTRRQQRCDSADAVFCWPTNSFGGLGAVERCGCWRIGRQRCEPDRQGSRQMGIRSMTGGQQRQRCAACMPAAATAARFRQHVVAAAAVVGAAAEVPGSCRRPSWCNSAVETNKTGAQVLQQAGDNELRVTSRNRTDRRVS